MRRAAALLAAAFALASGPVSARQEPPPPGSWVETIQSGDVIMPVRCLPGGDCTPFRGVMAWPDLLNRPKPKLTPERIAYGTDPNQVIDLWRPPTPGAHPVVAMIHGGCWQASVADLHIMDWAAADLAARGIAVWNLEYRRADQPGGGYPGTYDDVATALDKLVREARARGLRTGDGLVLVGHSAGGHLALWAAGRGRDLHIRSPRAPIGPARVRAVIDLAGIADLEQDTATACGPAVVAQMAGSPPDYPATSPAHRLPIPADVVVLHALGDVTVPPAIGEAFAAKARAAGTRVTVLSPPGNHVEEIAPGSAAWEAAASEIVRRVRPTP